MKVKPAIRHTMGQLGGRRSVHVVLFDSENGGLMFTSPIEKTDFRDGRLQPRALAERHKSQMVTKVVLSNGALRTLRDVLNEMHIP